MQIVKDARRRGMRVASGPCEIQLELPSQVPLVHVTVYPWWPKDVKERVLTAAIDAALAALPEDPESA